MVRTLQVAFVFSAVVAARAHASDPASVVQEAELHASDGASGDLLGETVALDGGTLIVGASEHDQLGTNSGSAYVFVRSGAGWSQQAELLASDGAASDDFGLAVDVSGNTAAVGARLDDVGGINDRGSAYVFTRTGVAWSQQQKITAADGQAGDQFGLALALDANTLVVGAWTDDDAGLQAGSAYVFTRSGVVWTQQAKLIGADTVAGDNFGTVVALRGNVCAIAARDNDGSTIDDGGAVYVFTRSGVVWTQTAKLEPSDPGINHFFGAGIDIYGDTMAIGGDRADSSRGAVYVFRASGTTWTQEQKLVVSDPAISAFFGGAVALGSDVLVASRSSDDLGGTTRGSVYVFQRSGTTWSQTLKVGDPDAVDFHLFGHAVAIDDDSSVSFAATALGDDDLGAAAGSVFTFALYPGVTVFCSGDGSATACPCGNAGATGSGCASSLFASGAVLSCSGVASLASDTLVLSSLRTSDTVVTFIQGSRQENNGPGTVFGDGLRCAGGSVIRLGQVQAVAGAAQYPSGAQLPVSVRGMVVDPGTTRAYQVWYRNAASFCTPSTFNLTNGLWLTWGI